MKRIGLVIIVGIILGSCESFLERDISDEVIVLNSPPKGSHSTTHSQTLWWNEVEGASSYQLQVVSPSFTYIQKLWLDTTVTTNQFSYTFAPDSIAWRVKALNDAYETAYTESVFVIDSTEKPQTVNLISPKINAYLNNESIVFNWSTSNNATYYYFSLLLDGDEIFSTTTTKTKITLPNSSMEYPEVDDGEYTWTVYSGNKYGNSDPATERTLSIDRIVPETPIILAPEHNDTTTKFYLNWKHPDISGSPINDSLIIYKDSTGKTEFIRTIVTDTIYEYTNTAQSWYLFKVKSFDYAGNESGWCTARRFYYKKEEEK